VIRTANGMDEFLKDTAGLPDNCGLTFDDVQRSTVHPHVFIPTREEKERMLTELEEIVVEGYPGLVR